MDRTSEDIQFMRRTIELAQLAEQEGNLPIGAVITLDDEIIAEGRNAIYVPSFDATRHAEMEALRAVPQEHWPSASNMTLYTSLEPCIMCFASILLHRIGRVVYGALDSFGGSNAVLSRLPPYFRERFSETRWQGPLMPDECDPFHARIMALEAARARANNQENSRL